MAKYRKKPVVIEAIQWLGNNFEDIKELAEEVTKRILKFKL